MNFSPRVQHKDALLFYVALSLFLLVGIAFVITTKENRWAALGITAFPALLLFLVWQQTAAKDMRYELQAEGLFLKRFFMKRLILYTEIANIEKATQDEAIEIVNQKSAEELIHMNNRSFKAFKSRQDVNEIIKYTSVPVIFSRTRGFKGYKQDTSMRGEFAVVKLFDGKRYILSPKETDLFITEIKKRMTNCATINS